MRKLAELLRQRSLLTLLDKYTNDWNDTGVNCIRRHSARKSSRSHKTSDNGNLWHRCAISVFHGSWNVPVKNTVALNGALTTGSVDKTRDSRTRFNETPERTRCTAVRNTRVITHLMLIMPIAGRDCFILVRPIRLTISDRVWLSTGCERLTKSSPVPAPVLYNEHACSTASIRETERSGKSNRDLG